MRVLGGGGWSLAVRRTTSWLAVVLVLMATFLVPVSSEAQTPEPTVQVPPTSDDAWLDETMARMTPADKVGQLFLVTFEGREADALSEIGRLVQVYRVGGVILSPENRNFGNDSSTPRQAQARTTRTCCLRGSQPWSGGGASACRGAPTSTAS